MNTDCESLSLYPLHTLSAHPLILTQQVSHQLLAMSEDALAFHRQPPQKPYKAADYLDAINLSYSLFESRKTNVKAHFSLDDLVTGLSLTSSSDLVCFCTGTQHHVSSPASVDLVVSFKADFLQNLFEAFTSQGGVLFHPSDPAKSKGIVVTPGLLQKDM